MSGSDYTSLTYGSLSTCEERNSRRLNIFEVRFCFSFLFFLNYVCCLKLHDLHSRKTSQLPTHTRARTHTHTHTHCTTLPLTAFPHLSFPLPGSVSHSAPKVQPLKQLNNLTIAFIRASHLIYQSVALALLSLWNIFVLSATLSFFQAEM